MRSKSGARFCRHELAHYQRGDLWKSAVVRLLVFVHWFNLLAWWAARRFEICGEWLCDDRVVREFGAAVYSRALMQIGGAGLRPVSHGRGVFSGQLFQRIRRVLGPRKDTAIKWSTLIVVTISLFLCGLIRFDVVAQQATRINPVVGATDEQTVATQSVGVGLPAGAVLRLGTRVLRQPTHAYRAKYSPDGKTLAVCGNGTYDAGSSVCLWDTSTGKLQVEIQCRWVHWRTRRVAVSLPVAILKDEFTFGMLRLASPKKS